MGPLRRALLVAALCIGVARAQDGNRVLLVPVEGTPAPGEVALLELALSEGQGAPLRTETPTVQVGAGAIVEPPSPAGPGRWLLRWQVPADQRTDRPVTARVEAEGVSASVDLPLQPPAGARLRTPERAEGQAGQRTPVRIPVSGADLPPAEALQVTAPEGQVVEVQETESGLVVLWLPPEDPLPRAVPLAFGDRRQPGQPPSWTVVRLVGHPRIPIATDPGAQLSLEVGPRRYGPYKAGPDGIAVATPEVWPGEASAVVVARDELGNESRTTLSLGGVSQPSLVIEPETSIVPGRTLPALYLGAFRVDGRPWTTSDPTCRTGVGEALELVGTGQGTWRATLPASAGRLFDVKIECVLAGQARAVTRVPVEAQIPAEVRLRVWPAELTADLPVGQVQAWLEGPGGDRLPASGLVLQAEHGVVTLEPSTEAMVVATYDGTAAVAHGGDRVTARWEPPAGSGRAWDLDVGLAGVGADGAIQVLVQARDRLGRPLAAAPLEVQVDADRVEATADDDGRASVELDSRSAFGPWVISARSGAIERRRVLFRTDSETGRLPAAGLQAQVEVPVRTGEVRRIIVEARPETIGAGGAESARVLVRLQDQSGQVVADPGLRIEAEAGRVGRVQVSADGGYEAEYRPPARLPYGEVEVLVHGTGEWTARTTIEVVPRKLRAATGLYGGWLYGSRSLNSPWLALHQDIRIPAVPAPVVLRLGAAGYALQSTVDDDGTGSAVQLNAAVFPLSVAGLLRHEQGRHALWGGPGLVVAPYQLVAVYGDEVAVRGNGLTSPGAELLLGAGRRFGGGELAVEVSYLLLAMSPADAGWEGPVGGLRAGLGWRLLY